MANELKKLIREAFNTAYLNYKMRLFESVESMKSKMSSGDIYKVENAFREIKNDPNMAYKYAWTPQGSANGILNTKQFNLLVEMVFENTDMETKKKIFMTMYSDKNPALINAIKARLMGMKGVFVSEEDAMNALEVAWNEIFLGEKTKSSDKIKKTFTDKAEEYIPLENSNFGAYLMQFFVGSATNALRDFMGMEKPQSLDAPSPVTGKSTDISSGEDFGSDALNPMMNTDKDLSGLGAGLEKPDSGDELESSDDYIAVAGDEEADDEENVSADKTIGDDLESDDSSPAEKQARKMIRILNLSLKQGIKEFRNSGNVSEAQERGLVALETILNTGVSPQEASSSLGYNATVAIDSLKSNKNFIKIVDDYLFTNGFLNGRGKVESFSNIKPMYLAQMVKYMKSNDAKHLSPDLKENTLWFIDELIYEQFVEKNLDKIMERVYRRLAPKINS